MTNDATTYQEMRDRILGLLGQHAPRAVPIQTIARELGIDRRTAAKYLDLLTLGGDVRMERFGPKKLYRPSQRVPLPEIFDHSPNALVILDADLRVSMVNPSFIAALGINPSHTLVGALIFDLDLPVFSDTEVQRNIERIRRSETHLDKMQVIDERTGRIFLAAFAPIVSPTTGEGVLVSLQDITSVRRTEIVLRDTEKKMATLFESVPSGIMLFAADGTILNANRASLRVLGLRTPADMRITSIFEISCSRTKLEALIREGRATEIELACDFERLRREQGIQSTKSGIAYFDVVFTPVHPDGGGPAKEFAILFKDITAKRRVEKDLKERLRGVSSNLPGIIYQFYARDTGEWGIYYVDARSADIFGLDPEPVRDWFQRFSTCIAPEDRERWERSTHETVDGRGPWDFEGRFLKPSGGEIFFRGISHPVRLEHETVWNGIFLDITDRRMAEAALQQSHFLETRYRSFFEDTCNGILIYEPVDDGGDYLITDANRVTATLLRTNRDDLVGKRLFEEFPDLSTPEIHALLLRILTTGRPEVVAPLRYREQEDFPLISHYVFKLPSGELASFMIDVSEVLEGADGDQSAVEDAADGSYCDFGDPGPVGPI